jgi:hypothetical protein
MDVINQHLDKENIVFTNNSKTNSIQGSWEEFKLIRKTVSSKLDESQIKDSKISVCCFFSKNAAFRSKSND